MLPYSRFSRIDRFGRRRVMRALWVVVALVAAPAADAHSFGHVYNLPVPVWL